MRAKNRNSGKAKAPRKTSQLLLASIGILPFIIVLLLAKPLSANTTPNAVNPRNNCPPVEEEIVDINELIDMVTKTKALGLLGKVKLKKDLYKLLDRLKDFHQGESTFSLEQLEEQYNVMLMKITAHIQDKDETLRHQLCNSWLVIWEELKNYDQYSGSGP